MLSEFTIHIRPTSEFIKEKWSNKVKSLHGKYSKKPKEYRVVTLPFNSETVKLANDLISKFGFKETPVFIQDNDSPIQTIYVEKALFEPFNHALILSFNLQKNETWYRSLLKESLKEL